MQMKLDKILCATDFSDAANHAVLYGIALAKKFEAKLYMCHIIDLSYADAYGEFLGSQKVEDRIMNYANERLQGSIGGQPVNWEPLISKGSISDEIARMVEEFGVNLAISATHGRSGLKRLILGSVTERLMRTLSCPLLVVRSLQHDFVSPKDRQIKLNRILVGCDFSPHSSLSFQYALSLAGEFGCELHLVHVLENTIYGDLLKSAAKSKGEKQHALHNELNDKLTRMIPEVTHSGHPPRTSLLAGEPYQELTKYALKHDIDLIVLGVRGQGLKETLHLGSTTDRVVRQASCPVLSVCPTCSKLWFV